MLSLAEAQFPFSQLADDLLGRVLPVLHGCAVLLPPSWGTGLAQRVDQLRGNRSNPTRSCRCQEQIVECGHRCCGPLPSKESCPSPGFVAEFRAQLPVGSQASKRSCD
jgi:hypothetical protein